MKQEILAVIDPVPAGQTDTSLEAGRDRAITWLHQRAMPLWAEVGRTKAGLFAERISLTGNPDPTYFRTFVQARHIFSFVEGGRLGWEGPWKALIRETMDVIIGRAKRKDGLYAHRLDEAANILDGRADLYDQAFVLLALAKAGGALSDQGYFDEAASLADTIDRLWAHPNGGYREGEIVDPAIRRQNPHMHLFEAFQALHRESGRAAFGKRAQAIAELCFSNFLNAQTGALLEYFDENWAPAQGKAGHIVEPGHCFEWAWLFEKMAEAGWKNGTEISDRLTAFARKHGLSAARGIAINEVRLDGSIANNHARLWPQTERLKAALARYARLKTEEELAEAYAALLGLEKYLDVARPGLWRDKMTDDGGWIEELAPGSSLYHISCAYAELASTL